MTKRTPEEITAWHQAAKRVDDAAADALHAIPGADTTYASPHAVDREWTYRAPCRLGVRLLWRPNHGTGRVEYLAYRGRALHGMGSFAHETAATELINLYRELSLGVD